MYTSIKIRRGATAARTAVILETGEPGWDTTTSRLYIGDGSTFGGILVGGTASVDVSGSITKSSGNLVLVGDSSLSGGEINLVYGINSGGTRAWLTAGQIATTISVSNSITNAGGTLSFVNDASAPGNNYFYGTDSGGTKGWQDLTTAPLTQFNFQDPDTTYIYDDNDEIIRVDFSDGRYVLYEYNDDNEIVYVRYFETDDSLIFGYHYVYDALGRIEEKDYFDSE